MPRHSRVVDRSSEDGAKGLQEYYSGGLGGADFARDRGVAAFLYKRLLWTLLFANLLGTALYTPLAVFYVERRPSYSNKWATTRWTPFCDRFEAVEAMCAKSKGLCRAEHASGCRLSSYAVGADLIAVSLVLLCLGVFLKLTSTQIRQIDEANATSQDYSVWVVDPDKDAWKPKEWRDFFQRFGTVRCVTVQRKNTPLINLLKRLWALEAGSDDLAALDRARKRIRALVQAKKEYPVVAVFVTFEEEESLRLCLEKMSAGKFFANLDLLDSNGLASGTSASTLFRGHNVLQVRTAPEVDDVGWDVVGRSALRVFCQRFVTFVFVVSVTVGVATLTITITGIRKNLGLARWIDGLVVAVANAGLPIIFRTWARVFEVHRQESHRQESMLRQLYAARMLNGIAVALLVPKWENMLRKSTLNRLRDVLLSDVLITPLARLLTSELAYRLDFARSLDWVQWVKLTGSARGSFRFFGGVRPERLLEADFAERLSDAVKICANTVIYSTLLPTAWPIGVAAIAAVLTIDNFLMQRRWRMRAIDARLIRIAARDLFLLAPLLHFGLNMALAFSWPFDSAARRRGEPKYKQVDKSLPQVDQFRTLYDLALVSLTPWRIGARGWMRPQQRNFVKTYRGLYLVCFAIFIGALLAHAGNQLRAYFYGRPKEYHGAAQQAKFSDLRALATRLETQTVYSPTTVACGIRLSTAVHVGVPDDRRPPLGPIGRRFQVPTSSTSSDSDDEVPRAVVERRLYDLDGVLLRALANGKDDVEKMARRRLFSVVEYFEAEKIQCRNCRERSEDIDLFLDCAFAAIELASQESRSEDSVDDADLEEMLVKVLSRRAKKPSKAWRQAQLQTRVSLRRNGNGAAKVAAPSRLLRLAALRRALTDLGVCLCGPRREQHFLEIFDHLAIESDGRAVIVAVFVRRVLAARRKRFPPPFKPPPPPPPSRDFEAQDDDFAAAMPPPHYPHANWKADKRARPPDETAYVSHASARLPRAILRGDVP